MFLILTLIIVVAAFNIISSMIMMVKDKGRDIAILRTMGASRAMILRIFVLSGASIGVVGTIAGFVARRRLHPQYRGDPAGHSKDHRHRSVRRRNLFLHPHPGADRGGEVAAVVIMALALSFLATLYPSWRAARLDPVEALALRVSLGDGWTPGPALELRGVRRIFKQAGTELRVLDGVDLVLRPGEVVALVGPSGAGKSTLLHVAGLLERPDGGAVLIGGEDCGSLPDERRTLLRRSYIGFVYQFHHLLPEFSALENVMLPQMIAGVARRRARGKAAELLDSVGLGAARLAPAGAAVGRRAAARRDRPRARQRPQGAARRRADRQSRPCDRRRRPEHAARPRPPHRPRRPDRDPQPRPRPPPRPHRRARRRKAQAGYR